MRASRRSSSRADCAIEQLIGTIKEPFHPDFEETTVLEPDNQSSDPDITASTTASAAPGAEKISTISSPTSPSNFSHCPFVRSMALNIKPMLMSMLAALRLAPASGSTHSSISSREYVGSIAATVLLKSFRLCSSSQSWHTLRKRYIRAPIECPLLRLRREEVICHQFHVRRWRSVVFDCVREVL
ncbi:hypothetical protein KC363_g206 [Hortaea werneckii]|nr:hypothetical protein KC363_g206 [Hortaea werneckii]